MNKSKVFVGILIVLLLLLSVATCSSTPTATTGGSSPQGAPQWVRNAAAAGYPDMMYVTATGEGRTMEEAQFKARANLLGIFGMRLADESVIAEIFQQTTANNVTRWNETVSSDRKISTSAEGILSGAEIKENWSNPHGTHHYALAVMEKARTVDIYSDIIARLTQGINEITNVPDRNTFDAYGRYLSAATIAKDIEACVNVLRFVGGSARVPAGLRSEAEFLSDAQRIIENIPVTVTVTGDRNNRVRDAFAKVFSDQKFQTGGTNARYRVNAAVEIERLGPRQTGSQTVEEVRYTLNANFVDTTTNQVLVPFSVTNREGHRNVTEAENRAFVVMERRVVDEYSKLVKDFVTSLKP